MCKRAVGALALACALAAAQCPESFAAPAQTAAQEVEQAAADVAQRLLGLPEGQRARALELARGTIHPEKTRHPVLRLFNMTNWFELPWFLVGLAGQLAFFARMAVQWIVSERKRQSVVPPVFWWLSLVGSAFLVTYGFWRKDIVIILGQLLGVVIYTRNLWLIGAHRSGESGERPPLVTPSSGRETHAPEPAAQGTT